MSPCPGLAPHCVTIALTLDSKQVRVPPHDWRVLSGGQGPRLVAFHGAGASADSMAPLLEALAPRFSVFAPDLPGHNKTRLGAPNRSGLAAMAEDTARMVTETFGVPDVVVGHSAGGAVALQTDDIWPDAKRVLINPALTPFDGAAGWVFPRLARALASAERASASSVMRPPPT